MFFTNETINLKTIKQIIWGYVGIFVIIKIISVWFGTDCIQNFFALKSDMFTSGHLWQIFTYSFLHGDFLHIFCNLILFYGLSRFLLQYELSLKKLLTLYILGILGGAFLWICINFNHPSRLIGASAGVATLLTYFCLLYPQKSLSLLLFFIFPIQIQARWVLIFTTFFEIFNCLFYETQNLTYIAHSAHLGGMLVGWLAIILQKTFENRSIKDYNVFEKHLKYKVHIETENKNNVINDIPFDILNKLKTSGLSSLSEEERKRLER